MLTSVRFIVIPMSLPVYRRPDQPFFSTFRQFSTLHRPTWPDSSTCSNYSYLTRPSFLKVTAVGLPSKPVPSPACDRLAVWAVGGRSFGRRSNSLPKSHLLHAKISIYPAPTSRVRVQSSALLSGWLKPRFHRNVPAAWHSKMRSGAPGGKCTAT